MIESLALKLKNIPSPHLTTLLLAAMPISELRGALPVAVNLFNLPVRDALCLSIIGNLIPVIPLLTLLDLIAKIMEKNKLTRKIFEWWIFRTKKRSKIIERYLILGLILFVATPLPFTGAWSGCLAAKLFNIKFLHALPAIIVGVVIAGFLVLFINFGVVGLIKIFGV